MTEKIKYVKVTHLSARSKEGAVHWVEDCSRRTLCGLRTDYLKRATKAVSCATCKRMRR